MLLEQAVALLLAGVGGRNDNIERVRFFHRPAADEVVLVRLEREIVGLAAEPLVLAKPIELLSSAVSFGTIQLLPDGQLIVLMADHQSTGGYPRIAHIISYDLPLIAQLGPGDKVGFHLVDIAEAEALAANFERDLSFFRVGCRFQANLWTT